MCPSPIQARNDFVMAEKKYGDPFQFEPMGSLFIASNFYLNIDGDDKGMLRRVRFLPCPNTIEGDSIRLDILEQFRRTEHAAAILKWVVDGACKALAAERHFDVPKSVTAFSEEIAYDNDHIQQWIEEECDQGPLHAAQFQDLYQAYVRSSERSGRRPFSERRFGEALSKKGFKKERRKINGRKATMYNGLRHRDVPNHISTLMEKDNAV